MSQNMILLVAVLGALIVGILMGVGVCYYISPGALSQNQAQDNEAAAKKAAEEAAKKAEIEKVMDERYPDFIKGTLNLAAEKITIAAEDGKEYWLWPVYPRSYYEEKGWKDGEVTEIQGAIMPEDDKIEENRLMIRQVW